MKNIFKKMRKHTVEEKNPLPLPELSADKKNPVAIADILKNGNAIWGWYKLTDLKNNNINLSALLNLSYDFDGLALFKKEDEFLVKYTIDVIGEKREIFLKISEICHLTNSNIMELFNTELCDAYKLFYDEKCSYSAECQCYVHDITPTMLNDYLTTNRVFHVDEKHFYEKKDYPDGLPTEESE